MPKASKRCWTRHNRFSTDFLYKQWTLRPERPKVEIPSRRTGWHGVRSLLLSFSLIKEESWAFDGALFLSQKERQQHNNDNRFNKRLSKIVAQIGKNPAPWRWAVQVKTAQSLFFPRSDWKKSPFLFVSFFFWRDKRKMKGVMSARDAVLPCRPQCWDPVSGDRMTGRG